MFSLQQSDELLLTGHTVVEANPIFTNAMAKTRRRKPCHTEAGGGDEGFAACDKYKKQKMRREIERQRRQDMASLYVSLLRSLLPGDCIKGKRWMSDHMNEAVNYIKHLEKKIKELESKKHELKKVSDLASVGSGKTKPASNYCFIIRPSSIGIEIMFRCGFDDQDLPLSTVLSVLVDEGLSVVSCVSTKTDEYLFHTIQTEVNDPTRINMSRLQLKLNPKLVK
ncbi:hypothetical protein HRI_004326200 [Hibiscus trionum]|uniref:BHLH domain-containing protein n=1 Tax=Hibiscus trionum TaxID=183268 RepID=A0A9W7J352_HIBTR|nr:hypothetical protein HRI_004326200 [Hibiscus trionum]